MEKKKKLKGMCVLKKEPPTISNYQTPILHKIATEIAADNEMFIPVYQDDGVGIKANLERELILAPTQTEKIDCGISLKIPAGFKIVFEEEPNLFSSGLMVQDGVEGERIKILASNFGKEQIQIKNGDVIALMKIEPLYIFEWIKK